MILTIQQFSLSTADDEKNYFTGQLCNQAEVAPKVALPSGVYRVMDNNLYRVVGGVSPNVQATLPGDKAR
jgi:hypothetical protein